METNNAIFHNYRSSSTDNKFRCHLIISQNKIKTKIQNWPSNFQSFSFQSSNFQFCHFSPLTFSCCQFSTLLNFSYILLLIEPKRRHFGSLFFFYNKFQNLKKKKLILKKKKNQNWGIIPHPNHSLKKLVNFLHTSQTKSSTS